MLKKTLLLVSIPFFVQAMTITALLDALGHRPENRLDRLNVEQSALGEQVLSDKLMPTVDLFAGYEVYSSPNGLLPVAPNELIKMVQDQSIGQPFSEHITREGVTFTWPLFVKSIYTLKEKAKLLHLASKEKHKLNLIERQAVVVGSVAQLRYLESLRKALLAKKHSILQTSVTTKIMVEKGRAAPSALFVLNSHINDIDIALNSIAQHINLLQSKIETLTAVHLKKSMPLRLKRHVRKGEIFALKPLKAKVKASKKGIQAADEAYIPSIVTKGNYSYSQANAYNNGNAVRENFGMAGIYLSMPIFDHSKSTASQMAKVDYMKEKTALDQTRHTLKVEAKQLEREIVLLRKSLKLAQKSVVEQQKLLKIAKVSFKDERMTEEEYLRYENALANARANFYNFEAKVWEDRAKLAVIYGNDLREIVK